MKRRILVLLLVSTSALAQNRPPRPGTTGNTIPAPINIPSMPVPAQPTVVVPPVVVPAPVVVVPTPVVVTPTPAQPTTFEPDPIPDTPTPSRPPRPQYEPGNTAPTPTPIPTPTNLPAGTFTWNKSPNNYQRYRNDIENLVRVGEEVIYRREYYIIRSGNEATSMIRIANSRDSYGVDVRTSDVYKLKGCLRTPYKKVCVNDEMIDLNRRPYKVIGINSENYLTIKSQDSWASVYEDIDPRDLDPR